MRAILKVFIEQIRKLNVLRYRNTKIAYLQSKNPSCTILSPDIYETKLGETVAVFTRTILSQVHLGNYSYISNDSLLYNVEVGSFCSIGPHVKIGLAPHPSKIFVSTYPAFFSNDNSRCPLKIRSDKIFDDSIPRTTVGHDVWIGSDVIIPGGITIGSGAIIAAGTVVSKDVPPYAVVGGNPAKIIRYRFSEEQIEILLTSEWWHWTTERIGQNLDVFSDMEKFKFFLKSNINSIPPSVNSNASDEM